MVQTVSRTIRIDAKSNNTGATVNMFASDLAVDMLASFGFFRKAVIGPNEPTAADERELGCVWLDTSPGIPGILRWYHPDIDDFVSGDNPIYSTAITGAETDVKISTAITNALINTALSGLPTAPTATLGTNTTQLATTAFVAAALSDLIAASPAALNTLNELAAALGDDENFAATMTLALADKAALSHTHAIVDVTGLQTALDAKQNNLTGVTGVIDPATGVARAIVEADLPSLPQSKITNLATDLAAKQDTLTAVGDVPGLTVALDAKLDDSQASAFGLTLLDDADATAARTTLGLGTAATQPDSAFAAASHTHSAADITSGILDPARIPVLPSTVQIASIGDLTALTAPQQAEIGDGSVVTTTDGRRWVYTGAGSKTAAASYIELADITPDWSVITNKPATFAPSAHVHVIADVTGLTDALAGKAGLSANTFTDEQTIAIPGSTSNSTQYLTVTLGSSGAPMGPFTSAYGYVGASIDQFVAPAAPSGGEPNADALFPALSIKSTFVGGSRGINCALLLGTTNTGHSGGGSFESGQVTLFVNAVTNTADTAFCMGLHTNINASAGGLGRIAEMDFIATGSTVLERIGNIIVSVNTDVATVNSSVTVSAGATIPVSFANEVVTIGAGEGFDYGFAAVTANGGAQAVNKGVIFGSGAPDYGVDFRYLTATQAAIAIANQSKIRGLNAAGSALIDMAWIAGDNTLVLGPDSAVSIASDKHLRAYGMVSLIGTEGLAHKKANGSNVAIFGYRPDLNGGNDDIVLWPAIASSFRVGTDVRPLATNTNDLGSSSLRWKTLYLQNAPDVVSDARLKTDFEPMSPALLRAGHSIAKRSILSWRWKSEPDGKRQIGPTVQDVIAAFEAEGLDPHNWALIGIHPVMETVETDEPVMTQTSVTRTVIEKRPRHIEKTREAVHWDDVKEHQVRQAEHAEWRNAVKLAEASGSEPPAPLPDDGWRPRMVTETYLEEVAELIPETDHEGQPVMIEVVDMDESGRVRVIDGQTAYKRVQKMRREIVYDDVEVENEESVSVQMTKPDGSPVWRSEERAVIDPDTGKPAVRYSLNHDQLNYLMTAALAAGAK